MSKPQRIRLRRAAGFNLHTSSAALNGLPAVVVSRPTKWGNPYKLSEFSGSPARKAELAVAAFSQMVQTNRDFRILAQLELRGKNLACWCPPGAPCHADILLSIANE